MIAEKILQTDISNALKTRYFIPLKLTHTLCVDPFGSLPSKMIIANNWSSAGYVDLAPKPQPWTTTSPAEASTSETVSVEPASMYSRKVPITSTLAPRTTSP